MCPDAADKMKKEIKDATCMLNQDTSIIENLVSLPEDDAEHEFVKEEDPFVVDLEKNEKIKKMYGASKGS